MTPRRAPLLALAFGAALAAQAGPGDLAHMQHVRRVLLDAPDRKAYLVVDGDTWRHARRDLADLRLAGPDRQVIPYAVRTRGAIQDVQDRAARIIQAGRVGGETRFWIRIPDDLQEYDRVRLDLSARNFVALARVDGANEEPSREWVALGSHSLFDFTRERLGSSALVRLPPTRFRYLRVTIQGQISPEHVQAAHVAGSMQQAAQWLPLTAEPERREEKSRTIVRWSAVDHVPLEGVRIDVDPGQQNFHRRVEVMAANRVIASGTIRRVHRPHAEGTVDLEELEVPVPTAHSDRFEAVIHNGDDPPLPIARVTPMVLERRLYFDPRGTQELELYFGDAGAGAPDYEFARLFVEDRGAQAARLGPVTLNPEFTPRPDTRPWTERHPALVWAALALAVLALGVLALRALQHG
jgi:hypothetical protein